MSFFYDNLADENYKTDTFIMDSNRYCVILAGGKGRRLWPSSLQNKPKQFIDLLGKGETLLQATYNRVLKFVGSDHIIVTTNEQYEDYVTEQIPGFNRENLLLEPMRRNTLPSATWATIEIMHRNPEASVLILPADQLIYNEDEFQDDLEHALEYVNTTEQILSLSVVASRPEINFGYVQMGKCLNDSIYKVKSFLEKPEKEIARMLVDSREFLWNTGIFLWKAKTFINYVHQHWVQFDPIIVDSSKDSEDENNKQILLKETFSKCPNITLEHVVMEHNSLTDVMLCHFGWSDLGNWNALYETLPKNDDDNVVIAQNAMLYDCSECIVKAPEGKIVVVQGLEDYLVVEDNNALVICKKDDENTIRKFVTDIQVSLGDEYV